MRAAATGAGRVFAGTDSAISARRGGCSRWAAWPPALLAAVFAALFALGMASCAAIEPEVRRSEVVLPPRIEGVAILPVSNAPGADMNDLDREFLRQQIRVRIDTHVPIKSFDAPPNALPSIAVLSTQITGFRANDAPGEQLFVRTVSFAAELELAYQASEQSPRRFRRAYSYQKIYRKGEQVTAQLLDVQNAMIEFAMLIDAEFYPSTDLDRFDPRTARDADTGEVAPVRTLLLANEHAVKLRYPQAVKFWRLALFDPGIETSGEKLPRLFKATRLTIGLLREEGVPEDVLTVLEEEFLDEGPVDFVTFREDLRDELEGVSKYEDRIGELSLYAEGRAHNNLAAAHANLARLARAQRQFDLATYHYALAWAHSREPEWLEEWKKIQTERRLLPAGLNDVQAIKLFLSAPPPDTAHHLPGPFDEKVLPPSVARTEGIQAIIRRAGGVAVAVAEPLAPVEVELEPVPLEPVPAQPVQPTSRSGAARANPAATPRAANPPEPPRAPNPPGAAPAGQSVPREAAPAPQR